jgi:hypothetical protein
MATLASVLALLGPLVGFGCDPIADNATTRKRNRVVFFKDRYLKITAVGRRRAAGAGSEANLVHTDDNDAAPLNAWTDAAPQLHPLEVDRHHFSLTF